MPFSHDEYTREEQYLDFKSMCEPDDSYEDFPEYDDDDDDWPEYNWQ